MSDALPSLERSVRAKNWRLLLLGALAILGVVVLGALILIQQRTDAERDRAIALQQHSFEVILRANQLSGAISAAEAALGRYVVSADRNLGQQYTDQWSKAGEQLQRLRQLTGDNRAQQREIAQLQRVFTERGEELNATALYSTYKRHRDAWGSYYQVRESPARKQLEVMLDQIVAHERGVLRDRTLAADQQIEKSSYASRVLTGFGMLIALGAVVLGWLAVEATGDRALADADAAWERERTGQLREAVAAATAQLRAEAREREQAEAKLRQAQKMDAVGQLTGGIAHDFNNMLAVVLGGVELARRQIESDPREASRHLDNAMEGAHRAAALTRQLLAFSRSESLAPEAVDAGMLIRGMRDLLDRTLGDTIQVKARNQGTGWRIWVDRHQLENAVLNLAVNARDAMNGRGTLVITTGESRLAVNEVGHCAAGDYVSVAVQDDGCGMTPDVLERVFEPFFTTKPVGKGTGLGLSQIFGFVRQSGGGIAIETRPGEGTTVTLYLPRHKGADLGAARAPVRAEPTEDSAGPAYDILVVEDDPRVLAATLAALRELGHRAVGCADPLRAAAAIERMPVLDLVMTDVLMPGQTGPEMVSSLEGRLRGAAVLFVTGFTGEASAEQLRDRPVLRKPFTVAALSRAVREAVAGEAQRVSAAAE
ncbi:ATP-binding protein [Sphingomonas sp. HT-1]|uniref:ATP-binding protein n=1 Tax=unclassified Sphingomonas TaxID=196159 RepID=UPI0002E36957|nr:MULTISPECIES: ATP-binding protein [unclassified Sphingomonas]KTF70031.1 kinase [Sphingomonas sp. WG]